MKAAAQQAKAAAQDAPGYAQRGRMLRDAPRGKAHLHAQEHGVSGAAEVPPAEGSPSSGSPGPQDWVRPAVLPLFWYLWLLLQMGAWGGGGVLTLDWPFLLLPQAAKAAAQQAKAAAQDSHRVSGAAEVPAAEGPPSSGSPGPLDWVRPAVLPSSGVRDRFKGCCSRGEQGGGLGAGS